MLRHIINPGLELRLFQPEDAGRLLAVVEANRAYLRQWLPWVEGMAGRPEAEAFVGRMRREHVATQAFNCGIYAAGELVGAIGHNHIDWKQLVANPGWWLVPAAQGQGIMTQCCAAVFTHAFTQLRVQRLIVGVATENARGLALVQRLGFTAIGMKRHAEWLCGRRVDHHVFELRAPAR
jgi:ribosomal-protein-serine acetyltransferase